MALPVVIVASGGYPMNRLSAHGGLPVTLAAQGLAVTEAPAGYGMPMTFVTEGGSVVLPVPPMTPATFNGTPGNGVVVSNGGLTATHTSLSNNAGVNVVPFKSTGKHYFEIVATLSTNNSNYLGIMLSTATFFSTNINFGTCINLGSSAIGIYSNGLDTGKVLGPFLNGNRFGFAIDLTARLAWIRKNGGNWNNDAGANPATGVGGVTIGPGNFAPAVRMTGTANASDNVTANFGASAFVDAVPSGFTAGWPT